MPYTSKIADLLTILDLHRGDPGPIADDVRARATRLCYSLSLSVLPKGAFDERFNGQLEHVLAFLRIGKEYWTRDPDFFGSFRWNCWLLVDAEARGIQQTIRLGELVEREQPKPA